MTELFSVNDLCFCFIVKVTTKVRSNPELWNVESSDYTKKSLNKYNLYTTVHHRSTGGNVLVRWSAAGKNKINIGLWPGNVASPCDKSIIFTQQSCKSYLAEVWMLSKIVPV